MIKVSLITNIISPYRIPLFNCLHGQSNIELEVLVLAEKEANREWQIAKEQFKFDYHILAGLHKFIWSKEIPIHLTWGLFEKLRRYKPDVVITSGYDTPAYWEAFLYCKLFKKKYILWNGTTLLSTSRTSGFIGRMKRVIILGADEYVTYGMKAAEYLAYMGAAKERIYVGVNTVDMDWFGEKAKEFYQSKSLPKERATYPKFLLLYMGRLVGGKGVFHVLKALSELDDPEIGFLIVGSGPQEQELRQFCKENGLENIYFEGFQQQEALPRFYALADVLILPTFKEVWGLVVNEALACGLYVLCSDRAGSGYDLLREGWNGVLFEPCDKEGIADLIRQTKQEIQDIRARRQAISEYACREFSIERSTRAFLDAIEDALNRRHPTTKKKQEAPVES